MSVIVDMFDVSAVSFRYLKSDKNKDTGKAARKSVYINGASARGDIHLQLCDNGNMHLALFGAQVCDDNANGSNNPAPSVPLASRKYNCTLANISPDLVSKFQELDRRCIEYVSKESKTIFGKELDVRTLTEHMYKSPLALSTVPGRSDLIKLKVSMASEILRMYSYNEDTKEIRCHKGCVEDISPRSRVIPFVKISSMWFIGNIFGYSLNVVRMVIDCTGNRPEQLRRESPFCLPAGWSFRIEKLDLPTGSIECTAKQEIGNSIPESMVSGNADHVPVCQEVKQESVPSALDELDTVDPTSYLGQ